MGLAGHAKLVRPVTKNAMVTYKDVEIDGNLFSYKLRQTMEKEAREGLKNRTHPQGTRSGGDKMRDL